MRPASFGQGVIKLTLLPCPSFDSLTLKEDRLPLSRKSRHPGPSHQATSITRCYPGISNISWLFFIAKSNRHPMVRYDNCKPRGLTKYESFAVTSEYLWKMCLDYDNNKQAASGDE